MEPFAGWPSEGVVLAPRAAPDIDAHRSAPALSIFPTLRGFRLAWLPSDLIAGTVLAAIAIPEQLATAKLARMPPEAGLLAFVAGSLAFALFGRQRYLSVGADSTIAPIFAGSIAALAASGSIDYARSVGVVALVAGVILVIVGALRAGWIADLLSIPVTIGFLAGIAVHIVVGQLPLVLGVEPSSGSLLSRSVALAIAAAHANGYAVTIGLGVFFFTLGCERIGARVPGALIGLVGSSVAVGVLGLAARGVAVVGALPRAAFEFGVPFMDPRDALALVPVSLVVAMVCVVQTALVVRTFPSTKRSVEDPAPDFVAVGLGSIAAAFAGSFAVDASPPRTAVVKDAGGRSQVASVAAVAIVLLAVAFGGSLGAVLPEAALGGVLLFIGVRLFRIGDMVRIARYGGSEKWFVLAGALLVVVLPIEQGMLLSIGLSLAHGVYLVARPPSTVLVRVRGTTIWWPPGDGEAQPTPGVLVFAPSAPITFTNADSIVQRLDEAVTNAVGPVRLLVIECGGVIYVDYTGAQRLIAALATIRASGIVVALARLSDPRAQEAARRTGLVDAVGTDRVFRSVNDAVVRLGTYSGEEPSGPDRPGR